MSLSFRIVLIVISVLCLLYVLRRIRQSKLQIEYSLFWIFCAVIFVVMAVFPGIMIWCSKFLGLQSPANFVFLCIIALLLLKVFMMTIELSQLENKVKDLVQQLAMIDKETADKEEERKKRIREKKAKELAEKQSNE